MINNFTTVKLRDIADFNPTEKLPKGVEAKKIGMDSIDVFTRKVNGFVLEKYSGGTKFRNGDTIMARITPCLENGKTAFINVLESNEVAFGSTEFIVLRAKKGKCDPVYLYYLMVSENIRNIAIKSMVGSSGRQRVQTETLMDYEIELPDLKTQKKIANILGSFDDKIEVNNKIIENLKEQSQLQFLSIFNNGVFLTENAIDTTNYSSHKLGELIVRRREKISSKNDWMNLPVIDLSVMPQFSINIASFSSGNDFSTNIYKLYEDDLIFGSIRSYFGKAGFSPIDGAIAGTVLSFIPNNNSMYPFLLELITNKTFIDKTVKLSSGTKMPTISWDVFCSIDILIPNEKEKLQQFNDDSLNRFDLIKRLMKQNYELNKMKKTILNQLITGEIDVTDLDI